MSEPSVWSPRRTAAAIAAAILVPAACGFAWLQFGPRRTPEGQPPLEFIEATAPAGAPDAGGASPSAGAPRARDQALASLREAFNAASDRDRIVALLSPT